MLNVVDVKCRFWCNVFISVSWVWGLVIFIVSLIVCGMLVVLRISWLKCSLCKMFCICGVFILLLLNVCIVLKDFVSVSFFELMLIVVIFFVFSAIAYWMVSRLMVLVLIIIMFLFL